MHPRLSIPLVWLSACVAALGIEPFQSIRNCQLVPTPWADGDSFLIRKPDGKELTMRLYGADCIEWHITDDTDARRLRAQRRYFGITQARPGAQEAIALAKGYGQAAAEKTAALLAQPFVVHTRMQKALGDGNHQRYYAYIECANGSDLATELVRSGLARAFGVCADGPGTRTMEEYRDSLADIELQAAKRGIGVWAATDWDQLLAERRAQREEDHENKIARGQMPLPADFRINPNTAARDELMKLPRIGEATADRIIEAREENPFRKSDDLSRVPGLKGKALEAIRPFLVFGASP